MKWKDRITRAKKKGEFTKTDRNLSSVYKTCAVGEKFGIKKLGYRELCVRYDEKKTNRLLELGEDFHNEVSSHNIKETEKTYNKIQKIKV